jgi:hypothetical protein
LIQTSADSSDDDSDTDSTSSDDDEDVQLEEPDTDNDEEEKEAHAEAESQEVQLDADEPDTDNDEEEKEAHAEAESQEVQLDAEEPDTDNDEEEKEAHAEAESQEVQLDSSDVDYEEVPAWMSGADAGGGYKKVIPDRFTEERDDRLMNSVLKNYSHEVKLDGVLTGHNFSDKNDALGLYNEVKRTHCARWGTCKGADHVGFEDAFNHFDVNGDGLIEAERMPQFVRYVFGGALDQDLQ